MAAYERLERGAGLPAPRAQVLEGGLAQPATVGAAPSHVLVTGSSAGVAGHCNRICAVKINPDKPYMCASAGMDGTVLLWDMRHLEAPVAECAHRELAVRCTNWASGAGTKRQVHELGVRCANKTIFF